MDNHLTTPQFSTKIFRAYLKYLEGQYPDVDLVKLCESSGLSRAYLQDPKNWVSLAFATSFSRSCLELTQDLDLHYKVGRIALDRDLIGPVIHTFVTSLASTRALYKSAAAINQTLTTVYRVRQVSASAGRCSYLIECNADHLSARDRKLLPEHMGNVMRNLKGYYEAIPTLKNHSCARVTIDESTDQMGLPRFMVDVAYQEARGAMPWWGWLLLVLAALAAAGALLGTSTIIAALVATSLLLLCTTSAAYLAYRRHWTVAHETVATLEELKQEHGRSHEANRLALNRMKQLEAIADVSRSVTINTSREDLMRQACLSLVNRLGYDRAIIFLADPSQKRLVYSAHAGDDERIGPLFEKVSFDIDIQSDDPSKISNVFRFQKPWLISDVKAHLLTLGAESRELLTRTGSCSFVCVPMASGSHCFGVIIADCFAPGKEIGKSDLDLLTTVGQQLAVAIEKLVAQQRELDAMKDAIRLKEQFLANTTHELKTPLNGIIGLAEALQDDPVCQARPAASRSLSMIVSSGRRLANLVDDVLTLAKAEHAAQVAGRESCDFEALCQRLLALLARQFESKGLVLRLALDRAATRLWIDEARIEQVLMNLVGNALKFTDRGFVSLDVKVVTGSDVLVTVQDTGIGIPADKLERIFEPFFQVDSSGDRRYGGAGLGLTIAREIVRRHGGDFAVESRVGEGSKFSFTLKDAVSAGSAASGRLELTSTEFVDIAGPLSPEIAMPSDDEPTSIAAKDAQEHVLIVDDDPVNIEVLVNHLTSLNYRVTAVSDGRQCLDSLASGVRPDIVLLDVMMPGMTGYEVCRRLRQNHSLNDLPVVFLTAKNQESDMLEALQAGGNDFISKPFRKAEVLARVGLHSRLASYARMTGRFVPWRGLEWLGYKSILDVRLGDAVDLDLTVMFTDLRDFTSITADMAPREIMRMINSYIRATAPVVARHGGLIDKYIGDGMMAIFRSPADAIRAAIKLIETVNEYNSANRSGGRRPGLTCRVALNSGGVTYGPMGYEERIELTPLSNVVNVASRLDGLAKVFGATLVAAEHMLASAPTDLPFRRLGSVSIRGRQEKLRLVEILAGETSDSLRRKIESRAEFEGNVELLESGQVSRALDGFLILARRDPGDQAVRYFLDQCRSQLASLVNTVDAAA